ncbi:MAG TPA: KilA-N domain-containing protein [Stenomitos sp.]
MSLDKDQIFYGDVQVRHDVQGFISLNDMWVAAGLPEGKRDPRRWKDEAGKEFIEFVANNLNVRVADIYKTQRGKHGGGTWAHWQIALAYAKYLSPEFHAWANQAIKDRIEEDHNPELGIERSRERAIENWRKQGKDNDYIAARIKGIDARNSFTGTLKNHNVSGFGYANCTDNIYIPILGGKAVDIRKQKDLPKKANVRDNMSTVELGGVMFAEILAADKIKRENRQGNNSCASACLSAGIDIKSVIDKHENSFTKHKEQSISHEISIVSRLNKIRDSLK